MSLVLVAGTHPVGVERVLTELRRQRPGTAVVHHDLREVGQGVVHRRIRLGGRDVSTVVELAHGCLSCTLREDVLPLVRALALDPEVSRTVLHLDPVLEPERVCWALRHVVCGDGPVADLVRIAGVITVVDTASWLDQALCDDDLADHGLTELPEDERTIAQLVVGQAEFADLLVLTDDEPGRTANTAAVLSRLAPLAHQVPLSRIGSQDVPGPLHRAARLGADDDPHGALIRGEPPRQPSGDVDLVTFTARRPFHPLRLHDALDVLLDGVVRTRGRIWLATRPDAVIWLESAGGGLQAGYVGDWLAASDDDAWSGAGPERRTLASLRWHDRWGDRAQDLVAVTAGADPSRIRAALRSALLTDDELAAGEQEWQHYEDPFGWWHTDPCADIVSQAPATVDQPADSEEDR